MQESQNQDKNKRFYGRRQGRPLKGIRAQATEELLPKLSVQTEKLSEQANLDPRSLFEREYDQYWFEIGFGAGEHLAELMRREPETGFLGAEPYINGMASFLKDIYEEPHDHVRVHMDDAMMLANSLSDACLDGLYVLNPDPWHKTRHHKRRMIRKENLDVFARILKPGAKLITTTDVPYLADWMITELSQHPAFSWSAERADDWRTPPDDWITTVYEVKGAKGAKVMSYLFFERV
tara:strand:+ start:843 stop:1550 length:708 start_codon:yes stop_codon:yes gene_type:complete